MNVSRALLDAATQADAPSPTEGRLTGARLAIARIVWWAVALVVVAGFVASVAVTLAQIGAACPTDACEYLAPAVSTAARGLGVSYPFIAGYGLALNVLFMVAYVAVAAILFWRRPDDRMALLASLALLTFGAGTFTSQLDVLVSASAAWQLPVAIVNYVGSVLFIAFLYAFPDGHLVPRWTRWVLLAWVAQQFGHYFLTETFLDSRNWRFSLQLLVWSGFLGSVIFAQVWRYRRVSTPMQRVQTKWVILGIAAAFVGMLVGSLLRLSVGNADTTPSLVLLLAGGTLATVAMLLIPLAIGVALLRYRLFDIDLLINRALVYAALTASVVALYALVVGGISALLPVRGNPLVALLATGVVAVLVQPLRERFQRGVNRLVYGQRDEPYEVLSRLGERIEGTLDPDGLLPAVVETITQALKLPYAAVALDQDGVMEVAAARGTPVGTPLVLPLVHQGEPVGELILSPRSSGEGWSRADRRLLDGLARQVEVAARAAQLRNELQHARERLVLAREEERRRLRRDLHDGLGPQLASQSLTLAAAAKLLRQDPDAAEHLLTSASTHARAAVEDIRQLVYALRPPALDDLGLVAALREQAAQYRASGVAFTIEAPERLPSLPAAVEVAAYRIAQEALTNVVKHASAHACTIRLAAGDALRLDVEDDGNGLPSHPHAGVGLGSMRERAAELGGICTIAALPGGGTRVRAELPLA